MIDRFAWRRVLVEESVLFNRDDYFQEFGDNYALFRQVLPGFQS